MPIKEASENSVFKVIKEAWKMNLSQKNHHASFIHINLVSEIYANKRSIGNSVFKVIKEVQEMN